MKDFDCSQESEHPVSMATEMLTEKLGKIIQTMPPSRVTLGHLIYLVGQDGLMLLIALLSLIFLIPVSIPGVSTAFGSVILLIAVSRLLKRELWVPGRFRQCIIETDKLLPAFKRAFVWLQRLEKISEPRRLHWLAADGVVGTINNCALILGAILLMAPFGLIPFSNTAPGLALLCFSIGVVQKDGACILLGHIVNVVTIMYFSLLIGGGTMAIGQAVHRISN